MSDAAKDYGRISLDATIRQLESETIMGHSNSVSTFSFLGALKRERELVGLLRRVHVTTPHSSLGHAMVKDEHSGSWSMVSDETCVACRIRAALARYVEEEK